MMDKAEQDALEATGALARTMAVVVGDGSQASHDWAEFCLHLHAIQGMIARNGMAREHPGVWRLLGCSLKETRDRLEAERLG